MPANGLALALTIWLGLAVGCADAPPQPGADPARVVVYTSFYPTTYFTRAIAGDRVRVVCPCPPEADPARWQPDEKTIGAYQSADLIILNGANFERWVTRVSLPAANVVDTARPLRRNFLRYERALTHSHGQAGAHTHVGIDGHTWMDPVQAKAQAGEILKALSRIDPAHAAGFAQNYARLAAALDRLDERFQAITKRLGGRALLANHPAYNYLARRYAWRLHNLDLVPGTPLDAPALEAIAGRLAPYADRPAQRPHILLWEAAPIEQTAALLRKRFGLESVEFRPCETVSPAELETTDYLGIMRQNLDRLAAALTRAPAPVSPP